MAFSWFSCKPCSESDPTQHMEIETPVSPVKKTDKENLQPRQSAPQNAKLAAKPEVSNKLLSREEAEAARARAEKEKTKQKEKEAKEAEKQKKQAQKEAKEKAEREAKEQKKEAEKRQKGEEARLAAARLQNLGPLGRTGAKLQVQLETGWADCGQDEFKQVCDHVAGGDSKFAIQARGSMYSIDWSNPNAATQKNVQSGKTRKLRVI